MGIRPERLPERGGPSQQQRWPPRPEEGQAEQQPPMGTPMEPEEVAEWNRAGQEGRLPYGQSMPCTDPAFLARWRVEAGDMDICTIL